MNLEECFDELASKGFTTYADIAQLYDPNGERSILKTNLRKIKQRLKEEGKLEEDPNSRKPVRFRYTPGNEYALTRKKQKDVEMQKKSTNPDASRLYLTDGLSLLMEGQHAPEPKFEIEEIAGLRNGDLILRTNLEKCLGNNIIQFKYMENFENKIEITFSPALLKEYNSRWNIVGFLHDVEHPDAEPIACHVPLDRVVRDGINVGSQKFTFKSYTDQQAYEELGLRFKKAYPGFFEKRYQDVVGMTVPENREVETIILKALSYKDYMYLKTKPLHQSQQEVHRDLQGNLHPYRNQQEDHCDDRNEWLFSIRVKWNFELKAKILGYGKGLLVEGESIFVQDVKQEIADMARNYGLI